MKAQSYKNRTNFYNQCKAARSKSDCHFSVCFLFILLQWILGLLIVLFIFKLSHFVVLILGALLFNICIIN